MSSFLLDHQALRNLDKADLAAYLLSKQRQHPEDRITAEIFDGVEKDSLPPDTAALWINLAQTTTPVVKGLTQEYSLLLRKAAIVHFGKWLKKPQWTVLWNQLGGAHGVLRLFGRLSVQDIKMLCATIRKVGNTARVSEREIAFEQLLRGLLTSAFPDASPRSSDERPLDRIYLKIATACSSNFVENLLKKQTQLRNSELLTKYFIRNFAPMFRQLALDGLFTDRDVRYHLWDYLPALLEREPPLPGDEDGLSASMTFCVQVLRRLISHNKRVFALDRFFSTLAEPFLRRAIRRGLDGDRLKELLQLMLQYIKSDPKAQHSSSGGNSTFILLVSRCWSRYPEKLEPELIASIKLLNNVLQLNSFMDLAHDVYKQRRYRLFQLYCLYETSLQIHIEDHQQVRKLGAHRWPKTLFDHLPGDHGLQLLQELIELRPEADFIEGSYRGSICNQKLDQSSRCSDPEIVLAHLQYSLHGSLPTERTKDQLEKRKTKALRSREQTDRAFWAKSALLYSIATGSLELYYSTLIWSQRYIRDPLTLKTLFAADTANTLEGIDLLAFPKIKGRTITLENIRSHVTKANEILLTYLETACVALREPSFQTHDWKVSLNLLGYVVDARVTRIHSIQHAANLLEKEVDDFIWRPTLDTLLQAEQIGLRDGHEKLNFRNPDGHLLSQSPASQYMPSVYRFLDKLAEERDNIWKAFRPKCYPIVAALPAPWPRGLPLQFLVRGYDVANEAAYGHTPYIASRAANVVQFNPDLALRSPPVDEDTRHGIGCFVDSFSMALQIQVLQQPSREDQKASLHQSWSYAIKELTGDRLNGEEALRFWRSVFVHALPGFALDLPTEVSHRHYPVLPTDANPEMSTEWDPAYGEPAQKENRALRPTILDCFLDNGGNYGGIDSWLHHPTPLVAGRYHPTIWNVYKTRSIREGITAAAILYIDAKRRSAEDGSRMLASPFPSLDDVRYPPLFLDSEFLLRSDLREMDAVCTLGDKEILGNVPPILLENFSRRMLEKLTAAKAGDPQISSLEQAAYGLLNALCDSDRPQLGSELVMQTILERPDASSWHRQLLTRTFLRRLSPNAAKRVLMKFAIGVQERLRLSKQEKKGEPDDPKNAKPFVKVTTVKFLAQILGDADFISAQDILDVLIDLFQNASHIDIRVAVIDALLERVPQGADVATSEQARQVFNCFASLVPVIGGVGERDKLTEEDWRRAEDSREPPEISDETTGGLTPLLMVFVSTATSYGQPDWVRREMIDRVILPAIRASTATNERWLRVFLRGHDLTPEMLSLPPTPVRPLLLNRLLPSPALPQLSTDVLDMHHRLIMANMRPSPRLCKFLEHLRSKPVLLASPAGKHFISLFDQGIEAYSKSGFSFASLLKRSWDSNVRPPVSPQVIQGYLFEQAETILEQEDPNFNAWNTWIRQCQPTVGTYVPASDNEAWSKNVQPLLAKIIQTVDAKRNDPGWKKNPGRKPCVLPPTFPQETWLLPYPTSQLDDRPLEEKCRLFAARVLEVLEKIAARGLGGGLEDFKILEDAVLKVPTVNEKVVVAHLLTSAGGGPIYELRLMIAERLVRGVRLKELDLDLKMMLKEMLRAWKTSADERVRIRGYRVEKGLGPEK